MKSHLIAATVTALVLCGCSKPHTDSQHFFNVSDAQELPAANLSDIIEVVRVVPLESSDSVVVGTVSKIVKHGGRYYVYSERGRIAGMGDIAVFDAATGAFVHNIGRRGEGPGEIPPFTGVDFAVTDTAIIVADGSQRLLYFNPGGQFIASRTLSSPAENILALPDHLLTYAGRDSLTLHLYSPDGNELMAFAPSTPLSNIGTPDRFIAIEGGKVMQSPTWCNETLVFDPATNSWSDTLITDIPDIQTLARYRETLAPTEFGTMQGKHEGTQLGRIITDGVSKMMITAAPDFSTFRLWISSPSSTTRSVSFGNTTDDITGTTPGSLPDILFSTGTPDGYIAAIGAESVGAEKDKIAVIVADAIGKSGISPESNPIIIEYRLR